jgi:Ca2+-binding RTX toxin-like protein
MSDHERGQQVLMSDRALFHISNVYVPNVFKGDQAGPTDDVASGPFDEMYGYDGNDNLVSDLLGKVWIDGGAGNDTLEFDAEGTWGTLLGGDGNDLLQGGWSQNADTLLGGAGDDFIRAAWAVQAGSSTQAMVGTWSMEDLATTRSSAGTGTIPAATPRQGPILGGSFPGSWAGKATTTSTAGPGTTK